MFPAVGVTGEFPPGVWAWAAMFPAAGVTGEFLPGVVWAARFLAAGVTRELPAVGAADVGEFAEEVHRDQIDQSSAGGANPVDSVGY